MLKSNIDVFFCDIISLLAQICIVYVVKTYPSIDPIAAPPILITILSVTFNNHERNVSYARYV